MRAFWKFSEPVLSRCPMHDVLKSRMEKDLFKVPDGSMGFSVMKYEKFIEMVSDSPLKLTFNKLLCVGLCESIKGKCPQLPEKAIKILFPFPTTYLCEADYFCRLQPKQ